MQLPLLQPSRKMDLLTRVQPFTRPLQSFDVPISPLLHTRRLERIDSNSLNTSSLHNDTYSFHIVNLFGPVLPICRIKYLRTYLSRQQKIVWLATASFSYETLINLEGKVGWVSPFRFDISQGVCGITIRYPNVRLVWHVHKIRCLRFQNIFLVFFVSFINTVCILQEVRLRTDTVFIELLTTSSCS